MKKGIIITLSVLILLIGALIAIPFFFRGDILRLIERQSSHYLRGQLSIGDMRMNMFENFPNLNVTLTDLCLSGTGEEGDTLLLVPRFEASVNLKSLIVGSEIVVRRVLLEDARLSLRVGANGNANWDILLPSEDEDAEKRETATTDDGSSIRIGGLVVNRLSLEYHDAPGDTRAGARDVSLQLRGNFSEKNTLMELQLRLQDLFFRSGEVAWLNRVNLDWETTVEANLRDFVFKIQQSRLLLNRLALRLAGSVASTAVGYLLDLSAEAPDTRIESLLALVPATYQPLLEGMKTTGEFRLSATAKGEYREEQLPAIDLQLAIANASLKYADLPESVEKINLDLRVANPGGSLSATSVDVNALSFVVAGNPFDVTLHVKDPVHPAFSGAMNGTLHFESLKRAIPIEGTLAGTLSANLSLEGTYDHIEKEEYEKLSARGRLSMKDILFKNEQFPGGVSLADGQIDISPSRLSLAGLKVKLNSSDARLDGYLDNYLPYFLRGKTLEGKLSLVSSRLNLDELGGESADTIAAPSETGGSIEVPANLRLAFDAQVDTLLFGGHVVSNLRGRAKTSKGVVTLEDLNMEFLKGKVILNGEYDAPRSAIDFRAQAIDADLSEAYNAFSFVREALPLALHCRGKVSAAIRLAALLDREMAPVMNTLNGGGALSIANVVISGNSALDELSALLQNEEISRLSISSLDVHFKMEQGNIAVEPFTTRLAGLPATISGKQSVDGQMDYTLSLKVDRARFGRDIEKLIAPLPGSANIKEVDVDVKVGGAIDKPTFTLDLSKIRKTVEKAVTDQVKENVQKEVIKGLEKLFKKK
jgi:uncharacterized protein involved in outer membrane biogenesis